MFPLRGVLLLFAAFSAGCTTATGGQAAYVNPYVVPEDTGRRASGTYFLRRAWVQITRDLERTPLPPVVSLDLAALAERSFAVAWLGHSSMLVRVDGRWILVDPVSSDTAGPVRGFGPARLTRLPFEWRELPHIDAVLISHDHYDHLDLRTMRRLAKQPGGPPRIFVGRGLAAWFRSEVGLSAEDHDWWRESTLDGVRGPIALRFTPAQHSSGRHPWRKNRTLWGGWAISSAGRTFYYSGDTAFVGALFDEIRARLGTIDVAALPIGAYEPRPLMRFEHTDPAEAVLAHERLGSRRSFGVHWATFQLGDEEPIEPQRELARVVAIRGVRNFSTLPVGGILDVGHGDSATSAGDR